MTLCTALFGLAMVSGIDDSIRLERAFRPGDQDVYVVQYQVSADWVNLDCTFHLRQTVKKLLESGEAMVQSELWDFASSTSGEPKKLDPSRQEKAEFRIDPAGFPVMATGKAPTALRLVQYAGLLGNQPLKLGQAVVTSGAKATGRVILESINGEVAKLAANWEIDPSGEEPVKIDMTSFIDRRGGKLIRASGTIVPREKNTPVQAIQFSIQREDK